MTKWEYLTRHLSYFGLTPSLAMNELGKEGWECCAVLWPNSPDPQFYFKREIQTEKVNDQS